VSTWIPSRLNCFPASRRIVHDLAQIERLSVSLALPPEGQEPLGDVAQPLRVTVQDLEIRHRLGRGRLLLGLHQHQFDA
jgi:hypothetical protein